MKIKKIFILPLLAFVITGCKDNNKTDEPTPVEDVVEPAIELPYKELTIMMDKNPVQIEYTILSKGFVSFSSSNNNIAEVDRKGVVTPLSEGISIISLTRGEYTATLKVIVVPYTPDPFLKVELANPNIKLLINDTYTPNYLVKYGSTNIDSSNVSFIYLYYNNEVISIIDNVIKCLSTGTSDILVSASYNSAVSYYIFSVTIL